RQSLAGHYRRHRPGASRGQPVRRGGARHSDHRRQQRDPDLRDGAVHQPVQGRGDRLMPTVLTSLGLAAMTTAQRDALGVTANGTLIWNADILEAQVYLSGAWQPVVIDPTLSSLFTALVFEIGRLRTAVTVLGLDPDGLPPDPQLIS